MRDLKALFALPAGLLGAILIPAIEAQAPQWPRDSVECDLHFRRDASIQRRLAQQTPVGVRKMSSDDEGQKFFLDYWVFEDWEGLSGAATARPPSMNISSEPLQPAIMPHTTHDRPRRSLSGRNIFARDYDCPSNTNSCSSIGYEDVCCPGGETCVETSEGVGCCPEGQTCGDSISECDASQGYTQCETDNNGGCCVPGAACESGGCVFYGTQTVYTTLPTDRVTTGVSTTIETSSGREITVLYTTVESSLYTTTETVTATPSGYTTTRIIVVGGGGSDTETDTDATSEAGAPILPTTDTAVSAATITSSPTTTISTSDESCPTGFYMCSARYLGGCCRVDRNCDTTSCPPQDTTTVVSDANATVVAATTGGSCANGWALCPSGEGGGCCPSGYACGAESCSASGQQDTAKMAPNMGSRTGPAILGWTLTVVGVVAGLGMVWL